MASQANSSPRERRRPSRACGCLEDRMSISLCPRRIRRRPSSRPSSGMLYGWCLLHVESFAYITTVPDMSISPSYKRSFTWPGMQSRLLSDMLATQDAVGTIDHTLPPVYAV
ncbi:hypothetical protein VTO73DRAFT_15094 [Trametes versicolor]